MRSIRSLATTHRRSSSPGRNTLALLCAAALTQSAISAPPIIELFEGGPAGWMSADMPCGGSYLNPLSLQPVQWIASGGDTGAHISASDPSGNCYYIMADPERFSGSLSPYAGGRIGWSVRCNVANYNLERGLILVGTNTVVLVGIAPMPVVNQWDRRCVPLVPESFRVGTQNGPIATRAQFDGVLASVHRMYLPAEYGAAIQETTGIDTVEIRDACIADLNGDGAVNSDDLSILLAAFGSTPLGDIDCNGMTNSDDLGILLSAFGTICD